MALTFKLITLGNHIIIILHEVSICMSSSVTNFSNINIKIYENNDTNFYVTPPFM